MYMDVFHSSLPQEMPETKRDSEKLDKYECNLEGCLENSEDLDDRTIKIKEKEIEKQLQLLMFLYLKYMDTLNKFLLCYRNFKQPELFCYPSIPLEYQTYMSQSKEDNLSLEIQALKQNFSVLLWFQEVYVNTGAFLNIPGYTMKILSKEYSRVKARYQTLVTFYRTYNEACKFARNISHLYSIEDIHKAYNLLHSQNEE